VILYLDTSSLVKLYLDEPHSDLMTEWAKGVGGVATSRVAEHLLRGFDAVHLAAACDLADRFPAEDIVFSSFDATLLEAARASGLSILHPLIREGFVMESSGFPWALAHER